ncbi:Ubiquinol oxidase 2 [Hibiscus syriacus]|uniref:Ubiquinol oxidase n=1 Tax=Hibiscus syriacus TaxID=106335 RepID=A0A6A2Z488_HIBSY|nr:Ubiquinol oxidase 2 [Hibiscus syriacus]
MNRFVLRSVKQRLVNGRSYYGISTGGGRAVYGSAVVELSGQRNGGVVFGGSEWRRMMSSAPASLEKAPLEKKQHENSVAEDTKGKDVVTSSYWGISRPTITREDGTVWPWNCFMPWETYKADVSIDVKKHHMPQNFRPSPHGRGMLLHLKSLRKFQHGGGWIKALLEEAENERMHLMTMVELVQPKWYERLLVLAAQGVYFNAFFLVYVTSPKLAHRFVGYLEEEAIISYTEYLEAIKSGEVENVPAPAIAIDYWRLPKDATLKDVITVIRADEAHHRDVNHFASDIQFQGKELREAPAPLGYH